MIQMFRILGKRGRITIPFEIRQRVGFSYNDVLSFTEAQDGRTVIVKREKICDNCAAEKPQRKEAEDTITLFDFLNGLSDEQQDVYKRQDQYSSMQEVTDDIKQMLYESGPVKAVFYCPLVGEVTDEEGFSSPVDGRFLKSYAWAVEEALEADTADDEMDMAEFFDEDDGVKAKLVSAKWGVETYRGRLFGRIECSLKEELTDAETEILTDWISGCLLYTSRCV